jgi:hypothetical protein
MTNRIAATAHIANQYNLEFLTEEHTEVIRVPLADGSLGHDTARVERHEPFYDETDWNMVKETILPLL